MIFNGCMQVLQQYLFMLLSEGRLARSSYRKCYILIGQHFRMSFLSEKFLTLTYLLWMKVGLPFLTDLFCCRKKSHFWQLKINTYPAASPVLDSIVFFWNSKQQEIWIEALRQNPKYPARLHIYSDRYQTELSDTQGQSNKRKHSVHIENIWWNWTLCREDIIPSRSRSIRGRNEGKMCNKMGQIFQYCLCFISAKQSQY